MPKQLDVRPSTTTGIDFYHYATVVSDSPEGIIYADSRALLGQTEMSWSPNSETSEFFADNGVYESNATLGKQEVSTTHAEIPSEVLQEMVGGIYNGALNLSFDLKATYCACLFRILKANGAYQYYRFWKGKYTMPERSATTKADSIDYQTQSITFSAVAPDGKDFFMQTISDDDPRVLNMGITPKILEAKIADFNWDPFAAMPEFAATASVICAPSIIVANLSDGEVPKPVLLGLDEAIFADTVAAADITAPKLPAGLTIGSVTRLNDVVVSVELTGAATDHTLADSITDLEFIVASSGIKGGTASLTTSEVSVNFA